MRYRYFLVKYKMYQRTHSRCGDILCSIYGWAWKAIEDSICIMFVKNIHWKLCHKKKLLKRFTQRIYSSVRNLNYLLTDSLFFYRIYAANPESAQSVFKCVPKKLSNPWSYANPYVCMLVCALLGIIVGKLICFIQSLVCCVAIHLCFA